jgi:hypothetical protein
VHPADWPCGGADLHGETFNGPMGGRARRLTDENVQQQSRHIIMGAMGLVAVFSPAPRSGSEGNGGLPRESRSATAGVEKESSS